jgi:hypothetical protein
VKEFVRRFFDNIAQPPQPGPDLIPKRWRVPFFLAVIVVSLLALGLVVRFVVIPGIDAQQSRAVRALPSATPK